jgi:N-acetylmuramic acid-specific PTS system IIC component
MEKMIEEVISAIGGEDNISHCTNCITRLRLTLKDDTKVDRQKVKDIKGVFGIAEVEQQFQIVLGPKASQSASLINSTYSFS